MGNGTLIGLFAGIFGALFYLLYGMVINPGFHELVYQAEVDKMVARGASQDQIDNAAGMLRFFTGPIWMAVASFFMSVIFCTILSLIIGIFVKRPPAVPVRS